MFGDMGDLCGMPHRSRLKYNRAAKQIENFCKEKSVISRKKPSEFHLAIYFESKQDGIQHPKEAKLVYSSFLTNSS